MAPIKIAVINEYKGLTDAEIAPVIKALNIQVKKHFAPVWGITADLYFHKVKTPPPANVWQMVILDNSTQAGILGYHDLTAAGQPLGKVYAGTDIRDKLSWS